MSNTVLLPELVTAPAVFAVGESYQIMVPVKSDLLFWVTVGDSSYYDHSNGILRSATRMHRVTVPMHVLDGAGAYTVHYRKIIERKPYFPESEEEQAATYSFRPLPVTGPIRIYHLADTHGNFVLPAAAGRYFGEELDLLVLNGDIPDHSGDVAHFGLIYQLCEALTGGSIPVVFSRGNHDTRGLFAEKLEDYTPTDAGRSYFTFRLGRLWGMVLDCGEDKPDGHDAYGYTNCCHTFREAQTDFIRSVITRRAAEYEAPGVEYRLVIAHAPFTYTHEAPFDIEYPIYTAWADLIGREIRPLALVSGHTHTLELNERGGALDKAGAIPVVLGSRPVVKKVDGVKQMSEYTGAALTLSDGTLQVEFTDDRGNATLAGVLKSKV